jgi:hypothetical protein
MRCKTFTLGFPGLLILEHQIHPNYGQGHFGYLSAQLANGKYRSVQRWSFDENDVTETELRSALERTITSKK